MLPLRFLLNLNKFNDTDARWSYNFFLIYTTRAWRPPTPAKASAKAAAAWLLRL
jgi:hypothetical protein